MLSKLHLKFILIFLLLLTPLMQLTRAQEQTSKNRLAFLKPLVGQKCAVHLKNGEVINGTLWVYGTDYVSVKVKKGLLYSKTEKYSASEIDYLKDNTGNRYYMPIANQSNGTTRSDISKNPQESIAKEEAELERALQGTFESLDKEKEENQESQAPPPPALKMTFKKTKPPVQKKKSPVPNHETEKQSAALKQKTGKPKTAAPNLYSARGKTPKKETRKTAKPNYFTKRTPARKQNIPETKRQLPVGPEKQPKKQQVKIAAASDDSRQAAPFWTQKFVMLGSGVSLIAFLFLFKLARVRYRKQTLFPTRIIEIQGKYAVIDHGKADGMKPDDIVRIYKKAGKQIQYKGKIRVKKVGENYSAVEISKLQPGQELEISDVGFRNRNLLAAAFKRFRIITSVTLRGLAKGLQFTAKNIDVKSDEPAVDLRSSGESTNSDVRTVVPQKQQFVRATSGPVTTVKSSLTSKSADFNEET